MQGLLGGCVLSVIGTEWVLGDQVMPFSIKHSYYGKWNASAVPYHKLTTCAVLPRRIFASLVVNARVHGNTPETH